MIVSSDSNLPKIAWAALQGTISCLAGSNLETIQYCPGDPDFKHRLTQKDIMQAIPEHSKIVQITETYETEIMVDSKNLLRVVKWVKSLDPELPVVLTLGTNNLHNHAFFLDVTLNRPGPVVFTGAMRPLSALSSDGPYNFVQACALAAHPSSRNRGAMILFSDRITPAFYGVKTSANRMDTFKSFEAGHLGLMNNLTPHFFYEPARATSKPYFDIPNELDDLPKVAVVHHYFDMDMEELSRQISRPDIKGVVIAGAGNSSIPASWVKRAVEASLQNFPIVRTSLYADSHTTPMHSTRGQIAAGDLGPWKSYLMLRLAIAIHGQDIKKIRQAFGTDFEPVALPQ